MQKRASVFFVRLYNMSLTDYSTLMYKMNIFADSGMNAVCFKSRITIKKYYNEGDGHE